MKDLAAERAVLAGIFQHGLEAYDDACDLVTAKTFSEENSIIYRCMEHHFRSGTATQVDYSSLVSSARSLNLSEQMGSAEQKTYLRSLMNLPVRRETLRGFAAKVRKLEIADLLRSQLRAAADSLGVITGDESVDSILAMAEGPVFDLTSLLAGADQGGPRPMGQGAEEYVNHLMDHPVDSVGISTGFPHYDRVIGGGVRANSLDVIGARPKTGKTALADNFSMHVAGVLGVPVLNLDTEMSQREHQNRILANLSGVTIRDIETGRCGKSSEDRRRVTEAAKRLADMPYHYECILGRSFEEVLSSMRRWVTRTVGLDPDTGKAKPCVVIYDYLKLMSADFMSGDLREHQALGYMATGLKNFMGRYDAGCVCFCQLNRDGIDREDSGAVAGSDRIVHYCTSFSIFKKRPAEQLAEHPQYSHKIIPDCSRHGAGLAPGDEIFIKTDYERCRMWEGPTRYQLEGGGGSYGSILGAGQQEAIPLSDR